jgi:hypothetical protein
MKSIIITLVLQGASLPALKSNPSGRSAEYHSFRVRACGTWLRFLFADTSVCSLAHGNK